MWFAAVTQVLQIFESHKQSLSYDLAEPISKLITFLSELKRRKFSAMAHRSTVSVVVVRGHSLRLLLSDRSSSPRTRIAKAETCGI